MRNITVNTKLVALLGVPLAQSVSHLMQNQVYEQLDLNFAYFPVELPRPAQLGAVVAAFREMNFAGFGVTKPYKETILQYLDRLDRTAEQIGACNTVVVEEDGTLTGYNTDGIGCVRSLELERGFQPSGKRVFSYGAGGAARAVLFQLAAQGASHISVAALDGMAQRLAADLERWFPGLCVGLDMDDIQALETGTRQADLVLNLTGLGMAPHLDETPMDPTWLRSGQLCYDAIYQPPQTRFLGEAERRGCQTLNGLGMVVHQGLAQIKLWTGADAPVELMYRALQDTNQR